MLSFFLITALLVREGARSDGGGFEHGNITLKVRVGNPRSHRPLFDLTEELSMKEPMSVVKPANLGVGDHELWISNQCVTRDEGEIFT